MRRYKQEITDKTEIEKILKEAEIARLGINRDGAPYIVPLNFGYAEGTFFFHCAGEGLKLDLLKSDPRVCIEVENRAEFRTAGNKNPCDWGMEYKTVIVTGRAEFITDSDEKTAALNAVISKFADVGSTPMPEQAVRAVTVFRVAVEQMSAKKSN